MNFRIVGADRQTGEHIEIVVDARDEVDAETIANRRNILVSSVFVCRSAASGRQGIGSHARTAARYRTRTRTIAFACLCVVVVGVAVYLHVATGSDPARSQVETTARREAPRRLPEHVRRLVFAEAARANIRAFDEADAAVPTQPDRILCKGDTIVLSSSLVLMGENNARDWFDSGARSMQLAPGTRVEVLRVVQAKDNERWAQVGAYLPGQNTGFFGWLDAYSLGLQHPTLTNEEEYVQHLQERRDYALQREADLLNDILVRYDITADVLEAIKREGDERRWAY